MSPAWILRLWVSGPGLSATTTTPEAKRTSGETDGNSGVKSTAKTPSPSIRLFGLTRPASWSISSRCSMAGRFNRILCEPRNTTTFRFSAGGCRYSDAVRPGNPSIGWLSIATMTSCPTKPAASAGPPGSTSEITTPQFCARHVLHNPACGAQHGQARPRRMPLSTLDRCGPSSPSR